MNQIVLVDYFYLILKTKKLDLVFQWNFVPVFDMKIIKELIIVTTFEELRLYSIKENDRNDFELIHENTGHFQHITKLNIHGNFITTCRVMENGVSLLSLNPDLSITEMGSDTNNYWVDSSLFLDDDNVLASDTDQNLILLSKNDDTDDYERKKN